MMKPLRLSLIQTELHWEQPMRNRADLAEKIRPWAGKTDVVILPEMFTSGFTLKPDVVAEPLDGETLAWMREMAAETNAVLTGSMVCAEPDGFRNRLLWVFPDGHFAQYDKRHLFRMAAEDTVYQSGTSRLVVEYQGWRICPLVCYDLRFPVWSRNTPMAYDLLIYVANWPKPRVTAWEKLLQARAIENLCYVAGVNRVGVDGNGLPYSGSSMVADFKGDVLWFGGEAAVTGNVQLDAEALAMYRQKFPAHLDADRFRLD